MLIKTRRLLGFLTAIVLGAALFPGTPVVSSADTSSSLAEINKLDPAQRKKRLEEGAKKEGEVAIYTSENINLITDYEKAFAKHYPFIKLKYWRAGGDKVGARVLTEYRANKLEADLIGIAFDIVLEIEKLGAFASYFSPERKFLSDFLKDKSGRYTPTSLLYAVMAYNTQLVAPKDAPADYPDLLDPKWKGAVSIDVEPSRAVMGWIKVWGEERTRKYVEGLVRNDVKVHRGHTLQTQLLCAGEHKASVELYSYMAYQMRRSGCPLAVMYPNPTPVAAAQSWGITSRAPHPHAAALFLDFMLSREGAEIVVARGRTPARADVAAAEDEAAALKSAAGRVAFLTPEDAGRFNDATTKIIRDLLKR